MPYIGLRENEKGETNLNNGIFGDVFKELSKLLNFSYTVIQPPDGQWGAMKSDGSWSGMIGQLETKEVDFGRPVTLNKLPEYILNLPYRSSRN